MSDQAYYLDNSATTRVCRLAAEKAVQIMTDCYANPSSLHGMGFKAKMEIERARAAIAKKIGAKKREIYFTSGATESNNLAVFSTAQARKKRGNRIITTRAEHPSVLEAFIELEKQGFEAIYIDVDSNGCLNEQDLKNSINDDTILVSIMLVCNETGAIFPVETAAKEIKKKRAPALLHTDAVQAFMKMPMAVGQIGADLISISGHKAHAPKGVGAIYVADNVHIPARQIGGGQERGLRSGTEAAPLICAFGEAIEESPDIVATTNRVKKLEVMLRNELALIENTRIHTPGNSSGYILNFSVGEVKAETMLHFLSSKGIYVSAGSACAKGHRSHVLEAMGVDRRLIDTALRVSFSRDSGEEDVRVLIAAIKEGISTLRKA